MKRTVMTHLAWVATAALLPSVAVAAAPAVAPVVLQQGGSVEIRTLIEATHERLEFEADVTRVAVGRSETLSAEILHSRELLILGREPGQTSLVVWFADGTSETFVFAVEPDLSVLRSALTEIHPTITLELAPDRTAIVLRGLVPDVTYLRAAESAASRYLESQRTADAQTLLISAKGEDESGEEIPVEVRVSEDNGGEVINLIRLETLPPRADQRIRESLAPLSGGGVTVRRVTLGDLPDDSQDIFVLEGTVPDQVTLTRTLFLASRALLGDQAQDDIRVLADEAGALTQVTNVFGAGQFGGGGGGGQNQGLNIQGSGQGGGGQGAQFLANRIGSNLGRAKVIEAAGGRILSMIQVEHLPQVRVDVRLYEVNLTRLRQWRSDFTVIRSDFDQGAFDPAVAATATQGANAASVGDGDLQNVLGFLGGELSNQSQIVAGGLAVDSLFNLLVNEQVARSLSRPSLTVLSGELALFQVGGQVPIPVAITVGGGTDQVLNSVEFRDFGLQLSVRPLVEELDSETITLDLSPIVSMPDLDLTAAIGNATGTSPGTTAFESRGTRTHTRLRDGDAMLIGGLISQRQSFGQAKTPGLGDIPLAGWLFRNETKDAEETELVILVNPVIVRPERPDARLWHFIDPAEALDGCLADVTRPVEVAEATDEEDEEETEEPPAAPQS